MRYFIYNGKILQEGATVASAGNRGLRYGDGLFETIRMRGNDIFFLEHHLERLDAGMKFLQMKYPAHFSQKKLIAEIEQLAAKNQENQSRIRLTVFRGDGGLFEIPDGHVNYLVQTYPLNDADHFNENGLKMGFYNTLEKSCDGLSNLKHNSHLLYAMAAIEAKATKQNDVFVKNSRQNYCDSAIANFFLVYGNTIKTPALSEGPIAGIMRRHIINQLPALGYEIIEGACSEGDILHAEEIFLTNAIKPVRWVERVEEKFYSSVKTREIYRQLFQSKTIG